MAKNISVNWSICQNDVFHTSDSNEWKYVQVLNALQLAVGVWYVVVSLMYLIRNKAVCSREHLRRYNSKVTMVKMMLCSGVLYTSRVMLTCYITYIPYIGYQQSCNHVCEVAMDVSVVLIALAAFPIYFYMWLRMKMLYYKQNEIHDGGSWFFVFLIRICLIYFITSCVVLAILFIQPVEFVCCPNGCRSDPHNTKPWTNTRVMVAISASSQLFVLAMILLVLIKQVKATGTQLKNRLGRAIKRLVISTTICISSDMIMFVLGKIVLPDDASSAAGNTRYEITLLVNMFALTYSVSSPSFILLPWKHRTNHEKFSRTSVSNHSNSFLSKDNMSKKGGDATPYVMGASEGTKREGQSEIDTKI